MKKGLYTTLAWSGIRNNKKLYVPYMLTCIVTVMMCYIISFLSMTPTFANIAGARTMQTFLGLGFGVMCVFSLIFLFYTNSFLIRRRKKEFGLYNVLGLGKRHLAVVLFIETLMIACMTIFGGLALGVLFSKFAELCAVKILGGAATFEFTIGAQSLYRTAVLFGIIFALIFLNTLRQVHLTNPIELLHSENVGEKPPKANWLLALIGVLILGGAYYMAVTIEDPVTAITLFFVAVIMVIIATYILFISGSVTLCRILQKNKRFYYKAKHFVSVSSMAYRMKRTGAGLASICILCTMVLVMISSTICLYVGMEDNLRSSYPRNIGLDAVTNEVALLTGNQVDQTIDVVEQVVVENGTQQENVLTYGMATSLGILEGDRFVFDNAVYDNDLGAMSNIWQIYIVSLSDYNRLMGAEETLEPNEAIVYVSGDRDYVGNAIDLGAAGSLDIVKRVDGFDAYVVESVQLFPMLYIFVSDLDAVATPLLEIQTEEGLDLMALHWYYGFDLPCDDDTQIEIEDQIYQRMQTLEHDDDLFSYFHVIVEGIASNRGDFYGTYGGLLFLGVLLGMTFVFAAVLIIYYRQVSEGYEDQSRFDIMQKVGMTKKEIRKSIDSQILIVFFMPLIAAGVHLAFAFPLIRKLLLLFSVMNSRLLIIVTICCYLIFAVFYMIVYRITSRSYFSIVSGMRTESA